MREARRIELPDRDLPCTNMLLRHFKGAVYEVTGFASLTTAESSELRMLVLYRKLDDPLMLPMARPLSEFMEEVKDDEGNWVRRFTNATGERLEGA